ncbi:MAG TPA: hypothetical protein EYG57_08165 [Planctomycetes bacterium]|nr:hypothetical protein [Planctomycetota bacterium]
MGRGPALWTDDTIQLVKTRFIAVAVPTWVCRATGPEGDFLRAAGIDNRWVTSSGYMHCVSASGKFLGGRASTQVLDEFAKLPDTERRPGAIEVRDLQASQMAIPSPPIGGLVLKVHARFLHRNDKGELRHAKTTDFSLMRDKPEIQQRWQLFLQPNTEYMWLTKTEWKSLIPPRPVIGEKMTVVPAVAERMARFHLTPQRATTSEGHIIHKRSIKIAQLSLVVEEVSPQRLTMQLLGFIHWGSEYDAAKAITPDGPLDQGFETPLYGRLEFDRRKQTFTRFDIVAPGHIWGRWGDANRKSMYVERAGRTPFGFAFELASGNSPSNRIPPGGNGNYVTESTDYFSRTE